MRKFYIGVAIVIGVTTATHAELIPVTVTPDVEQVFKDAATHDLLDPAAAQFRNVRFIKKALDKPTVMCAEINGKNRYGAYTGFRSIAVLGDEEHSLLSPDFAAVFCEHRR
jgi:hypothetical protein